MIKKPLLSQRLFLIHNYKLRITNAEHLSIPADPMLCKSSPYIKGELTEGIKAVPAYEDLTSRRIRTPFRKAAPSPRGKGSLRDGDL